MKKTSSNNIRTCIISKDKKLQDEMIRVTKVNKNWFFNKKNYQGRSFYISKDKLDVFLKDKKFQKIRYFKMTKELEKELREI